jgi:hypothetical protein
MRSSSAGTSISMPAARNRGGKSAGDSMVYCVPSSAIFCAPTAMQASRTTSTMHEGHLARHGRHCVGHQVHGVRADRQHLGAACDECACALGDELACSVPAAGALQCGEVREVGLPHDEARTVPLAQRIGHLGVDELVVVRRRDPRHPTEQPDRAHAPDTTEPRGATRRDFPPGRPQRTGSPSIAMRWPQRRASPKSLSTRCWVQRLSQNARSPDCQSCCTVNSSRSMCA